MSPGHTLGRVQPHSGAIVQQRRITVLMSSLLLTIPVFAPMSTGAVLAKAPQLDVRGTWELTWRGVDA